MTRILVFVSIFLVVVAFSVPRPVSSQDSAQEIKLKIESTGQRKYKIVCEESGDECKVITARHGDWIAWTHDLDDGAIVVEFFTQVPGNSRALWLFGNESRNVVVHKGKWTWMRVQEFADADAERAHGYRVRGYSYEHPPPGVIVCPPGQTCP